MINQQIAKIFNQIAELLEVQDIKFKPSAYRKVARILESMSEEVTDIYKDGGLKALEEIPGVGVSIAEKIEEFIKEGRVEAYEKLKKTCPVDMETLTAIEGLGPKTIKELYDRLQIKNLRDLEKAAQAGQIRALPNFGEKTEKNILKGIAFVKKSQGRFLLGHILYLARELEKRLIDLKYVQKAVVAGSIRRMKETVGDLDFLAISHQPKKVMDFFTAMPEIEEVYGRGPTKASVRLKNGLDADLRVISKESFGSAWQYFTGNKEHNIATRRLAISKKLKLNEYGVFRGKKQIAGQTEKQVYQAIGLPYIEPELRTNSGEIAAALAGKLPKIINYSDLKGDLHTHSDWSDGDETIGGMAEAAMARGYQYMALTDHIGDLKIAHALKAPALLKRNKAIDKLNSKFKKAGRNFVILKGGEVDINLDGTLDMKDEILAQLDIVAASVHSYFRISKEDMTERICRAMKNPYVSIIGHPTGRRLQKREEYQLNWDKFLECALQTKTILEINAFPERLDLNWVNIRRAGEWGVKMIISTDAHSQTHLKFIELGIGQARRGWAAKKDILNTQSLPQLLDYFRKKH